MGIVWKNLRKNARGVLTDHVSGYLDGGQIDQNQRRFVECAERLIARRSSMVEYVDAAISNSKFDDVDLSQSKFNNVNMQDVTFDDINMAGVKLNNVNLSNCTIGDANLTGMTINGVLVADLFRAYAQVKAQ
jgi:uncharacterized protein YjbI with pentapeptide repeats